MTIKGSKSSSPRTTIVVPDSAGLTFPNSDFSVGFRVFMDGTVNGDGSLIGYVFRTGEYGNAGGLIFAYSPIGSSNPGRFMAYVNGSGSVQAQTGASVEAGKAYVVVLRRLNGVIRTLLCPVLQTAPTDGSAVIQNTNAGGQDLANIGSAMDGPLDMMIGNRNDGNRGFDSSFDRLFRIDRALTDFEIAQLAYGKEVTDFGTPAWYFKFKSTSDMGDYGPSAFPTTVNGPYTNGTPIAAGYTPPSTDVAPTISGVPVLTGTVQVGQTVGYTPAASSGNPSPTRTQQWLIDGVAVSGATSQTYTPVTADAGKSLSVRQIATNSVNGTPASTSATSAGSTVQAAPVVSTVDVAEQISERIFQQISGYSSVSMSGTYGGATTPAKFEYQLYTANGKGIIKPWADLSATFSGGTWSANPSLPEPKLLSSTNRDKYYVEVRSKDASGNVLASSGIKANRFGVGDVFGCVGSSSAYSWFTGVSGNTYVPNVNATSRMTLRDGGSGWGNLSNDGVATQMADYLSQKLVRPVAVMHYGQSGVTLVNWLDLNGTPWTLFRDGVTAVGGKIAGAFISVGSNDAASNGLVTSKKQHYDRMVSFIGNIRSHTGQASLPLLWSGFNRRTAGAYMPAADYVRQAENDIGDYPYTYHVQALDYDLSSDGIHLSTAGFVSCGQRMQFIYGEVLTGGTYYRGPKIVSLTYSGSTFTAKLQHRFSTDFTPTSNITGFSVTDSDTSGVALAVNSVVRTDSTTITGTTNRAMTSPVVKYLSGVAPDVGTPVYGNGTIALPTTVETEIPTVFSATVPVTPTVTSVTVSPSSASLAGGGTQQFSAVVNGTNSPSQGVTWSATVGSISSTGLFTAPASSTSTQSITVTATSTADTTQKGTATVTIPAVVPVPTVNAVTVSPATSTIAGGGVQQFTASVTGTNSPSQSVTWSASAGTINASGLFAGPPSTASAQIVTITATSTLDTQKKGTAAVTVQATVQVPDNPVPVDFVPSASRTIKVRAGSLGFTGGPFWDMSNPFRPVGRMDPDSIIDVTFDWSEVLADIKSSLANVEFNLSGGLGTDKFVSGSQATVLVTRNGTGQISITSRITTASNPIRRMDATVLLKVEDL